MNVRRWPLDIGLLIAFALCVSACAVDQTRRGLPPAAQTAIDNITDDIAAARDDKIYDEAADEWRRTTTRDASHASFERVRNTLGRVLSRALVEGREEQTGDGHAVAATFNTRFERGDAIEAFTLVERDGRWQLARYTVHSDALR